jgi:hypothetical protein
MATINHIRIATGNTKAIVAAWQGMANGDVGDAIPFSQYADKSVQVTGSFGDGVVVLEGSNNGTDWAVLTDPQGNHLNITGAKIEQVTEVTCYVRPRVTGTSGASINVHLLIKE